MNGCLPQPSDGLWAAVFFRGVPPGPPLHRKLSGVPELLNPSVEPQVYEVGTLLQPKV